MIERNEVFECSYCGHIMIEDEIDTDSNKTEYEWLTECFCPLCFEWLCNWDDLCEIEISDYVNGLNDYMVEG